MRRLASALLLLAIAGTAAGCGAAEDGTAEEPATAAAPAAAMVVTESAGAVAAGARKGDEERFDFGSVVPKVDAAARPQAGSAAKPARRKDVALARAARLEPLDLPLGWKRVPAQDSRVAKPAEAEAEELACGFGDEARTETVPVVFQHQQGGLRSLATAGASVYADVAKARAQFVAAYREEVVTCLLRTVASRIPGAADGEGRLQWLDVPRPCRQEIVALAYEWVWQHQGVVLHASIAIVAYRHGRSVVSLLVLVPGRSPLTHAQGFRLGQRLSERTAAATVADGGRAPACLVGAAQT
jgi:hypothetical protein